jgi:hypothetical protein
VLSAGKVGRVANTLFESAGYKEQCVTFLKRGTSGPLRGNGRTEVWGIAR